MSANPTVRVGHSPDPDDAFMFYALTFPQFDTTPEVYAHSLIDIETLNRDAESGKYEVTALSFHAYAYVADKYILLPHGASFGDNYGPMIVAKAAPPADATFTNARAWLEGKTIAIPGTRTSAFLALNMFAAGEQALRPSTGDVLGGRDKEIALRPNFKTVVVPFDEIIARVASGEFDGGLIIHEGQWEVCTDAGFNGRCRVFGPGRYADLGRYSYQLCKPPPVGAAARHRRAQPQYPREHRLEPP